MQKGVQKVSYRVAKPRRMTVTQSAATIANLMTITLCLMQIAHVKIG